MPGKAVSEPCARREEMRERWVVEVKEVRVPGVPSYAEELLTTGEGMEAAARLHCLSYKRARMCGQE